MVAVVTLEAEEEQVVLQALEEVEVQTEHLQAGVLVQLLLIHVVLKTHGAATIINLLSVLGAL